MFGNQCRFNPKNYAESEKPRGEGGTSSVGIGLENGLEIARSVPIQVLDRNDEKHIDWDKSA
jgi:hypothetical protein